jgi:hypothetical protein
MPTDPGSALLLGAGGVIAALAAAMTPRRRLRGWSLITWAAAASLFALASYWTFQDMAATRDTPKDRLVVVGAAAIGFLISGFSLLALGLKGSNRIAKMAHVTVSLLSWIPWRIRLVRVSNSPSAEAARSALPAARAAPADPWRANNLRTIAALWELAEQSLLGLSRGFSQGAQTKGDESHLLLYQLIEENVLTGRSEVHSSVSHWANSLVANPTKEDAERLEHELHRALAKYYGLAQCLARATPFLVSPEVLRSDDYGRARERANNLAKALERLQHTELNGLAQHERVRNAWSLLDEKAALGDHAIEDREREIKLQLIERWRAMLATSKRRSEDKKTRWLDELFRHQDWYALRANMKPEIRQRVDDSGGEVQAAIEDMQAFSSAIPSIIRTIEREIARLEGEWTRDRPENLKPSAPAPPMAPMWLIETLREKFEPCRKAARWTFEVLVAEIWPHINEQHREKPEGWAAQLSEKYIGGEYDRLEFEVLALLGRNDLSEDEFLALKERISELLVRVYPELLKWFVRLGPCRYGETFIMTGVYKETWTRHQACLTVLQELQPRHDLGDIARDLTGLRHALPTPDTGIRD